MRKAIIRGVLSLVVMIAGIFGLAGRSDYWQGWVFTLTVVAGILVSAPFFGRMQQVIAERWSPGPGQKPWDKVFWALYLPGELAIFVVSALDAGRYRWTGAIPPLVYWCAYGVFVGSVAIVQWAKFVNQFFSTVVRLQTERGHHVVDRGPYGFVRHPGYLGGILMAISSPVVLGSYWGLVPGAAVVVLILARTYLEDCTLRRELLGYEEYTRRVRYRIFPGIW